MTVLSLFSEPFAPTGNMAGEGFKRLLGRPALGLLQTVLRESIQNVVDAAVTDEGPRVLVRIRTLSASELAFLQCSVLGERVADPNSAELLDSSLAKPLRVLEIADFRTIGLSGSTRADLLHDADEAPNFVNFFRNVGAARDAHHGGGTYGYGKSALYAMSHCATVIADSLTKHRGAETRRLLACHLGGAFDIADGEGRRRYTGRHWWGVDDETDGVDPLGGSAAEALSAGLGLPVRNAGQTGTTIVIIDPELPDYRDVDDIAREIIEAVLWNFWPRMTLDCPPRRRLEVEVEVEGRCWGVPSPEGFPPLDLFAKALTQVRTASTGTKVIECERPRKELGRLAVVRGMASARDPLTERDGSLVPRQSCHIALMRPVELVVKYLKGTPFPDSRFEWAGVFVCDDDDEVEGAFAQSEPPAHDDWVPDNLPKGREKTFVRVGLRRLKEESAVYVQTSGSKTGSSQSQEGLVASATILGSFLADSVSAGPGRDSAGGRGPAPVRGTAAGKVVFERLLLGPASERLARFRCLIRNEGTDPALSVAASAFVSVEGGSDKEAEVDHPVRIVALSFAGGSLRSSSDTLSIGGMAGELTIDVLAPDAAAIGVKVELRSDAR